MFGDKIINFFSELEYKGSLPPGISIMNPYRENPAIIPVITQFYRKFYGDSRERTLILGINPGRFGAGVTGIPFTDSKRLEEKCGLTIPGLKTFETSSVFVYELIDAFGGAEMFYKNFFISAVCPLGFTSRGINGKSVNYNYYDSVDLMKDIKRFIVENLKIQLGFGIRRDICICFGTGKNYKFLLQLNDEFHFFEKIIPLEHPRFIMQYKSKQKEGYIEKYLDEFKKL